MKPSNARKRRAQRGRPRKEGVGRTPSGAISRANDNIMGVAIAARMRVLGVSAEEAPRQEGGSALGRLWGRKQITLAQREAGDDYAKLYHEAQAYQHPPRGFEVIDGGTGMDWDCRDFDAEAYTKRAIDAIARREGLRAALVKINAEATVHYVAVLDMEPLPVMLPALIEGLGLLVMNARASGA